MRYELYEYSLGLIHDLVFAKDDLNVVVDVMLVLKEKMGGKYVIIDNEATPPINYKLLGFDNPIAKEEHYQIFFDCKFSKYLYEEAPKDDTVFNCYYDIYDKVKKKATEETKKYTERLYK